MPDINPGKQLTTLAVTIVAVVILFTAASTFYTIDGTERGVMINMGKPDMTPLTPGFGFKIPYVQTIDIFNIQTQKYTAIAAAASKDLQNVQTEITVNYRLDPTKVPNIYVDLGHSYEEKVIQPAVQETVKQVTAEFTANDLIQKRPLVKAGVETGIRNRLAPYGILIDLNGVSLTGFEYSEEFSKAIEAKVTAVQLKDKAQNDLERIKIERDQKIAQAEADLKYATPDMIALKQIEVNKLAIERWNGVMPQYVMGDGANNVMSMLSIGKGVTA